MKNNIIYNEDCRETIKRIRKSGGVVDLILTSPPYNTCRGSNDKNALSTYQGRYDVYSESLSNDNYDKFTSDLFNGFDSILTENGVVIYNISYGNENPTQMWTCIADVCKNTNFTIAEAIVWKKKSALPNNTSCNKLTRICEFVFVLCRKDEYMTFNCNKQVVSTRSSGQKMYENIFNLVVAPNNDGACEINKAAYSSELCEKLLSLYAPNNAIVYDPFMGTGTTAVACKRIGLRYIGSEISPKQCEYANNRLKGVKTQLSMF